MATRALARQQTDRHFYTGMSFAVAVIVFAGFARTYYLSTGCRRPIACRR